MEVYLIGDAEPFINCDPKLTAQHALEKILEKYFGGEFHFLSKVFAIWINCEMTLKLPAGKSNSQSSDSPPISETLKRWRFLKRANSDSNAQTNGDSNVQESADSKVGTNVDSKPKGQTNKTRIRLQLEPEHILEDVENKIKNVFNNYENFIIRFELRRNCFYPIKHEEQIKEKSTVLQYLYREAKENVNNNRYPIDLEKRMKLSGIEFSIEEKEKKWKSFLHQKSKTLPHTNSMRRVKEQMTMRVRARTTDPRRPKQNKGIDDLYLEYLKVCREYPCYGGISFDGQMERSIRASILHSRIQDKPVSITINEYGLHVTSIECSKLIYSINFKKLIYGIIAPKKPHHYYGLFIDVDGKLKQIFCREQAIFIDRILKKFISIEKNRMLEQSELLGKSDSANSSISNHNSESSSDFEEKQHLEQQHFMEINKQLQFQSPIQVVN